jgi:hypothetical protein
MQRKPMRGQGSETVTVLPGPGVREFARQAELERWAWRRVQTLRLFYTHLSIYVISNLVLLLIDLSTPGDPWFYDVLLGWGLFLGLHALHAYDLVPWSTFDWEERTMKRLIEKRLRD